LLDAGIPDHCEIELDFPGCYVYEAEEFWFYYFPAGDSMCEPEGEGKCYKYDEETWEATLTMCCPEFVYRHFGAAGSEAVVLQAPTECPDALEFDGCYVWEPIAEWGWDG
jgi:hypothetical protein